MGLKVGRFWDWVLLEEEVVVVGWPERGGRLKGEMEEGAVVLVLVLVLAVLLVVFVEEEKEDEAEEEQPPHSPHVRGERRTMASGRLRGQRPGEERNLRRWRRGMAAIYAFFDHQEHYSQQHCHGLSDAACGPTSLGLRTEAHEAATRKEASGSSCPSAE